MKKIILFLIVFGLVNISYSFAQAEKFKALFIYNFIKNIEWPQNYKQGDFVIGVLGTSQISKELESIAKVQKAGNQTIVVKNYNKPSEIDNCNVLFISQSKSDNIEEVYSKLNGKSTLIIGNKKGLAEFGSGINFLMDGDKIKYEISKRNIEKAGLKVGATLLTLGTLVN